MKRNIIKVSDVGISVDYPIGQLLEINGKVCEVAVDEGFHPCALLCAGHGMCRSLACSSEERKDGKDVVFDVIK